MLQKCDREVHRFQIFPTFVRTIFLILWHTVSNQIEDFPHGLSILLPSWFLNILFLYPGVWRYFGILPLYELLTLDIQE